MVGSGCVYMKYESGKGESCTAFRILGNAPEWQRHVVTSWYAWQVSDR